MATSIQITLVKAGAQNENGNGIPIQNSQALAACEVIAAPTTSQVTTLAATEAVLGNAKPHECMWRIFAVGDVTNTKVAVQAGTGTPAASATTSQWFEAPVGGMSHHVRVTQMGEKLAVINA